MFSDLPGDPHSPVWPKHQPFGRARLPARTSAGSSQEDTPHAFAPTSSPTAIRVVDRLFLPLCVATLALPFWIGYLLTGTLGGAFSVLLWAGVLRVAFLHQITWSTNSVCHMFGRRPFRSNDQSTNFAPLAVLSMGESWHNGHHAFPSSARHGVDPRQLDLSAMLIRRFEKIGWVSQVRWPDAARRGRRLDA
jgi:stearoyl-CoA desaturase (delta-9 desaturase)